MHVHICSFCLWMHSLLYIVVVKFYVSKLHYFTYRDRYTKLTWICLHRTLPDFPVFQSQSYYRKMRVTLFRSGAIHKSFCILIFPLLRFREKRKERKENREGTEMPKRKSMWPLLESMYRSISVCITCISCTQSYCLFEYMIQLSCV